MARLARELGSIERVVLLAGGLDAGVHRAPEEERALVRACARGARRARDRVRRGGAADRRRAARRDASCADLDAAVAAGLELAQPGDGLLLAPMFPLAMADRERFSSRWS